MPEPASSSTAAGIAGWKLMGGFAGAAGLAAVVVMLMTPPRSAREWAVGLTSTVMGSACGGAFVIRYFGLHVWLYPDVHGQVDYFAIVSLIGIIFACGLPGWATVRWSFTWMQKRKSKDIGEIVDEVMRRKTG